ncbi:MAG: class IV adenylate cyclase [Desulfurococcales archaeon]|nr:class IV adenylate cyclase [Desulfurococcales archaeon]
MRTVLEYEVKIPVDDLTPIKEKLVATGWELLEEVVEVDRYVDMRGCVNVPEDTAFRVRKKISSSGAVKGEVTYKGPRLEGDVKAREEINVEVKDPDALAEAFLRLGFRVYTLKKVRQVYSKEKHPAKIYVDEVDGLGKFVEVEVMDPGSLEKFREVLNEVKEELGLQGRPEVIKPYLDMYLEEMRK